MNQNPTFSDQESYLSIAKQAYETDFQYRGDRNRMPIYPYLLALLYNTEMSTSVFFELGKIFNVLLSFMLLIGLFLIFQTHLSKAKAFLLTFIVGSSLFIYKSGYVQPELLYYFMYFVSYFLMQKMLSKPKIELSIVTGIIIAATYLVKASVVPSMIIFLGLLFFKHLKLHTSLNSKMSNIIRSIGLAFIPSLVVLITFLFISASYLFENKKVFGKYFYNVNTTFYVWYDSWDNVVPGTYSHGDRVGWPEMPDNEIPSMQKYFKEHSIQQVVERFKLGSQSQLRNITKQYSFFNYPLVYSLVLIICLAINLPSSLKIVKQNIYQILLFVFVIGANLALFSFYSPITNYLDARFTYGLYLPYIYTMFLSIATISRENNWNINNPLLGKRALQLFVFETANLIVIGLLVFEFIYHIPIGISGWYGK